MAQVGLFKKVGTYEDKKDGKEKQYTNFYVRCGDSLIPVQAVYFEGEDGKDYQYNGRKAVLSAFAEPLPEKDDGGKRKSNKSKHAPQPSDDDGDIPF